MTVPRHPATLLLAGTVALASAAASPGSAAVAGRAPLPGSAAAPFTEPTPAGSGAGDGAEAWVLRVDSPSGPVVRLADAAARAGTTPTAQGAPFVAGDAAPVRATADPGHPDQRAVATPLHWTDPSGSLTLEGGFAEAQASPTSATARAGFGTAGGTGFPMANRLLTWEQQERLLAQMNALNGAIFVPLNARIAALAPVLGAAGVAAPRFEPASPVGLVDVGRGRLAAASAEVAGSGDFASGRAEATAGRVRLLGGFVDAVGLSSEAVAERSSGGLHRRGGVWFAGLTVAGVPAVADGGRIRVASNDIVSREVVQPALDLLLATLLEHGVDLRAGEVRDGPEGRRVAALELTIASAPARPISVSVAGAAAAAPAVAPAPVAPPGGDPPLPSSPTRPPSSPPLGGSVAARPGEPVSVPPVSPAEQWMARSPSGMVDPTPATADRAEVLGTGLESGAIQAPGRRPSTPRRILQPLATARSLRAVYLVLVVAAVAGALVLPALVTPAPVRSVPRRRRP